jgi:hypothetical protein
VSAKKHKHTFTALWSHFGQFGRQDIHVHGCFDYDCDRVVIGKGRECDGKPGSHHRETLKDDIPKDYA